MKNSRNRRVLLAGKPNGEGAKYCAEPNSKDGSLGDNAIGNNNAESFKLIYSDRTCWDLLFPRTAE